MKFGAILCLMICLAIPGENASAQALKGDVSLNGTAVVGSTTTGHGITQTSTISGGALLSARVILGSHTSVELNYGLTKSSQVYTDVFGNYSELQTHIHELTAAYVLRKNVRKFRLFAEGGGGALVFSPISTSGSTTCPVAQICSSPANSNNLSFRANQQTRWSLLVAAGADYPLTKRLAARIQYRGFLYKAPDFGVSYFNDGGLAHITEPSIGIAYSF